MGDGCRGNSKKAITAVAIMFLTVIGLMAWSPDNDSTFTSTSESGIMDKHGIDGIITDIATISESATTIHSPIYIDGDDNFTEENGVVGGSGSNEDPYIISGWEIDASNNTGITITNSASQAIVENVIVRDGGSTWIGLWLDSCSNVTITDCTFANNKDGIATHESFNITITRNGIQNNTGAGINLLCPIGLRDSGISVTDNIIAENNRYGILCEGSGTRLTISDNRISDSINGISIHWIYDSEIRGNLIANYDTSKTYENGIYIACSVNTIISDNHLINVKCTGIGINIYEGMGGTNLTVRDNDLLNWVRGISAVSEMFDLIETTIINNTISDNYCGLYLQGGASQVFGNSFINNTIQAIVESNVYSDIPATVVWNQTYPNGGNHWSDYSGVDEYSGVLQDIAGADGFGDQPYMINQTNWDYYPLIESATVDTPPCALFTVSPYFYGNTSTIFTFDASPSWDDGSPNESIEVRWDWQDDGIWDTVWSMEKSATHQYPIGGIYVVRLEVRDSSGLSDQATRTLIVEFDVDVEVMTEHSAYAPGDPVNFTISVTNLASETITIIFGDSQQIDFEVLDHEGNVVYDYSPHVMFWVSYMVLGPQETLYFDLQWDQTSNIEPLQGVQVDSPGVYEIVGQIAHWEGGMVGSVEIVIEDEPPITAAIVDGTAGADGWYTSSVNVCFDAYDAWSAVDFTEYTIAGSDWTTSQQDGFIITEDGIYDIQFRSTDIVGNVEQIKTIEIRMDCTAPTLNIATEEDTIFSTGDVNISWECSDLCSGIDHVEYCLDDGSMVTCDREGYIQFSNLSEGTHDLVIVVFDEAGNEIMEELAFEVDIQADDDPAHIDNSNWPLIAASMVAITATIITVLAFRMRSGKKPSE